MEEGLFDLPEITEYRPQVASLQDIARAHICVPSVKVATKPHLIAPGNDHTGQLVTGGKPGGLLHCCALRGTMPCGLFTVRVALYH